jgi:hypothetical protein
MVFDSVERIPSDLVVKEFLANYPCKKEDFNAGTYSMFPGYLDFTFEQSRSRMNLQTLDCVFLTTPFEAQAMKSPSLQWYYDSLASAFEFYESQIQAGTLISYGITANQSLVLNPRIARFLNKEKGLTPDRLYQSLFETLKVAEKVGGKDTHGFRYIHAPYNKNQLEAEQMVMHENHDGVLLNLIDFCKYYGINFLSTNVNQSKLRIHRAEPKTQKELLHGAMFETINSTVLI